MIVLNNYELRETKNEWSSQPLNKERFFLSLLDMTFTF